MTEMTIRVPDDFHVHLRQGDLLTMNIKEAARYFGRILVMPNTVPPVRDVQGLNDYLSQLNKINDSLSYLMTFKLHPETDVSEISVLKKAGAVAGKYYPAGTTTNSQDGVRHWQEIKPHLAAMEKEGLVLSVHAELPESSILEREKDFIPVLEEISHTFPDLKIVVEHVSSEETVEWIMNASDKIGATVTAHHLLYTLDDLMGGSFNPHLFCKPVVKGKRDRQALQNAVLSAHPRFFFGSDSAPHTVNSKRADSVVAGVFSLPSALPLIADFFEKESSLDLMEGFLSLYGSRFYSLPLNRGKLQFIKQEWTVPEMIQSVVPLAAGQRLKWALSIPE